MKKCCFILSLTLGLFVSVLSFTACSSDDDENETKSIVVGTWSGYRYDGPDKDNKNRMLMFVFKSDGYGTITEQDDRGNRSGSFQYVMEGSNKGKIRFDGYVEFDYFFVIEGNQMKVYDKGYGEDIDWILTKE